MERETGLDEACPSVTVVVPTLVGGAALEECLRALEEQTLRDFDVIVVDNGGKGAVRDSGRVRVIVNQKNVGFGAAANQGFQDSRARFLAVLNDDAVPQPGWLESLVTAMESRQDVGMCASKIRLAIDGRLDSAGMLVGRDGSSKQRGHLESAEAFSRSEEALLPSGCAAFYRRDMLEEVGLFDESFFLYCEDTDLGLRARWAGWECLYVPDAVVDHRYSHSAGKASGLKAYYVERNRLFLLIKSFPMRDVLLAPFYSLARYFWHVIYALFGRGAAAQFRREGNRSVSLASYVLRAYFELLVHFPDLWRKRKHLKRRLTERQFHRLIRRYSISARQVAAL